MFIYFIRVYRICWSAYRFTGADWDSIVWLVCYNMRDYKKVSRKWNVVKNSYSYNERSGVLVWSAPLHMYMVTWIN